MDTCPVCGSERVGPTDETLKYFACRECGHPFPADPKYHRIEDVETDPSCAVTLTEAKIVLAYTESLQRVERERDEARKRIVALEGAMRALLGHAGIERIAIDIDTSDDLPCGCAVCVQARALLEPKA